MFSDGRLSIKKPFLAEKGDRSNLCKAPFGPFRQIGPVPFFYLIAWFRVVHNNR
jgi:hypothetical protein